MYLKGTAQLLVLLMIWIVYLKNYKKMEALRTIYKFKLDIKSAFDKLSYEAINNFLKACFLYQFIIMILRTLLLIQILLSVWRCKIYRVLEYGIIGINRLKLWLVKWIFSLQEN